jgi:anthranilate synthase/aminodeoxychorismate synthase-like glutamine amidotransferase
MILVIYQLAGNFCPDSAQTGNPDIHGLSLSGLNVKISPYPYRTAPIPVQPSLPQFGGNGRNSAICLQCCFMFWDATSTIRFRVWLALTSKVGLERTKKAEKMILLIDNHDSFTWNLWHFLSDLGAELRVIRNDEMAVDEVLALKPDAVVISPGPCTPNEAGICIDLVRAAGTTPVLGVCLGFQAAGMAFGGSIKRLDPPVHGKLSPIIHQDKGLMKGCANPVAVTRYHSLILDRKTLPDCFEITAETEDGIVMGISHKDKPIYGLLFHPESIASINGYRMLANFLDQTGLVSLSEKRLAELEKHTLNLSERYPELV